MALPKIVTPEFDTTLPSGKKIRYRPFLVKEQKILLMAMESGESLEVIKAILQIIRNCILTKTIDVEDLSSVDVEHLFLQIRKRSVGETLDLMLRHEDQTECDHVQEVHFPIDDIKLIVPEDVNPIVMLSDTMGFKLRQPPMVTALEYQGKSSEMVFKIVAYCIESIFDGDEVVPNEDMQIDDLEAWVEELPAEALEKVYAFIDKTPYHQATIKYTCSKCKKEEEHVIRGASDFFT